MSNGETEDIDALDTYARAAQNDDAGAAALFALGVISAHTGSTEPLRMLIARLDDANPDVAEDAAIGLALTGTTEARATLQAVRATSSRHRTVLAAALEENRKMAKLGLRGYYNQSVEPQGGVVVKGQAGIDP